MNTPHADARRFLQELYGVPSTPPLPRRVRRTLGCQLQIEELGIIWSCDATFTVSGDCIDDIETVALSPNHPRNAPWLDIEFDQLSERSKDAVMREAYHVLRDSHVDEFNPEFHPL